MGTAAETGIIGQSATEQLGSPLESPPDSHLCSRECYFREEASASRPPPHNLSSQNIKNISYE